LQRLLFTLAALSAGVIGLLLLIPILGFLFLLLVTVLALVMLLPLLAKLPWFRNWIRVERFNGRKVMRFGRDGFMGYHEKSRSRQTWNVNDRPHNEDDVIDVVPQIISSADPDEDDDEKPKP